MRFSDLVIKRCLLYVSDLNLSHSGGASLGALPMSKGSMPIGGVLSAAAGGGSAAAARFAQRPGRMRGRVRADDKRGRPAVLGSDRSAAGSSTSLRRELRATTGESMLALTHARADPGFECIGSPGGTTSERIGGGGLEPQL